MRRSFSSLRSSSRSPSRASVRSLSRAAARWLAAAPLTLCLTAATPALAAPKRPTVEEAVAAASSWHAELIALDDAKSRAAAAAASGASFFSAAYDETGDSVCPSSSAASPAALARALECLSKQLPSSVELVAFTKKDDKALKGPLRAAHGKRLAAWAKTATLVHQHVPCVGEGQDLILAVAWEGPKDQPALRIVAALNQKVTCGE